MSGSCKRVKLTLVVLAALTVSSHAAGQGTVVFVNGSDLFRYCQDKDDGSRGLCNGYIAGVADATVGTQISGYRSCSPYGRTVGQVHDVVVQWLARHPQHRHKAAPGLIAAALAEAFPCR
jgi:hypothetical protein